MTGDKAIDPEDMLRREPIGEREDVNAEGAKEDAEDAEFKSCSLSRSAPSAVLRVLSGEGRIGTKG